VNPIFVRQLGHCGPLIKDARMIRMSFKRK